MLIFFQYIYYSSYQKRETGLTMRTQTNQNKILPQRYFSLFSSIKISDQLMYSPFMITQRKDMFLYGPVSRWHVISTLLISAVYLIKLSSAEGMVHLCIFNITHTETHTHTLQVYMDTSLITQPTTLFEEASLNNTSGKQKSKAPCSYLDIWTLLIK